MNKFDTTKTSIFEKTMNACLEAKRVSKPSAKKAVTNEKKKSAKAMTEAVKRTTIKKRKAVREDMEDPEDVNDVVDDDTPDDMMGDVIDDVQVVVDPELDSDEVDEFVQQLQDVVDDTPDGEVPTMDDYVDDFTYTCPICGNTFFSDTEMSAGDACPVCGDTPTAFVLLGSVAPADDDVADDDDTDVDTDVVDDVTDDVDVDDDEEELEVTPPSEDGDDVPSDESFRRNRRPAARRTERKKVTYKYTLDENTFNPYLTKFIRENYNNAKSFKVVSAKRSGKSLTIECKITFKSGSTKAVTMKSNNFVPGPKMSFTMRDNGVFKSESKKDAPFTFSAKMENKVLKCTGLRYNFITKTEGKRVKIYGNLVEKKATPTRRNSKRV